MDEKKLENSVRSEIAKLDRGMLLRMIYYWELESESDLTDIGYLSFVGLKGHFDRDDAELRDVLFTVLTNNSNYLLLEVDEEEDEEWFKESFLKSIDYLRRNDFGHELVKMDLDHEQESIERLLKS